MISYTLILKFAYYLWSTLIRVLQAFLVIEQYHYYNLLTFLFILTQLQNIHVLLILSNILESGKLP